MPSSASIRGQHGLIQPTGQRGVPVQSVRLLRQNDEHRLRDFLGGGRLPVFRSAAE